MRWLIPTKIFMFLCEAFSPPSTLYFVHAQFIGRRPRKCHHIIPSSFFRLPHNLCLNAKKYEANERTRKKIDEKYVGVGQVELKCAEKSRRQRVMMIIKKLFLVWDTLVHTNVQTKLGSVECRKKLSAIKIALLLKLLLVFEWEESDNK